MESRSLIGHEEGLDLLSSEAWTARANKARGKTLTMNMISHGRFQGRPKRWAWLTFTKLILLPSVRVLKKDRLDVVAFCLATRSVSDHNVARYHPWDIPAEAATMVTRVVIMARSNLKRVEAAILAKDGGLKTNVKQWLDGNNQEIDGNEG